MSEREEERGHAVPVPNAPDTVAVADPEVEAEFAGIEVDAPRVGIVMGSKSDMPAMEAAAKELEERGIHHEVRVMSAHRDPEVVADYARNAQMRGLRVIIAGAGLSAALPGVVAAHSKLPVSASRSRRPARSPAASTRCSPSPRCRRACRWPASGSTLRATRPCWPRASSTPRRRSGARVRGLRDGPHVLVLLDHVVAVAALDDGLHVRDLVSGDDDEAVGLGADRLVRPLGYEDLLEAAHVAHSQ